MTTRVILVVMLLLLAGCGEAAVTAGNVQQQCATAGGVWRGDRCDKSGLGY